MEGKVVNMLVHLENVVMMLKCRLMQWNRDTFVILLQSLVGCRVSRSETMRVAAKGERTDLAGHPSMNLVLQILT